MTNKRASEILYYQWQSFLEENLDYGGVSEAYKKAFKALKQTGWIPVTEDTPSVGEIVLWCNNQGSVFSSAITYRNEYFSDVGKHGYFGNGFEQKGNILAWMPLPEPFKAKSEE